MSVKRHWRSGGWRHHALLVRRVGGDAVTTRGCPSARSAAHTTWRYGPGACGLSAR